VRRDILVRGRGLKISAPRICDDSERYGADADVDGVKAVLVPRAVIIGGDDEVRSLFGIAEHVLDQSFVDAHSVVWEGDGGIGGQPGDQGLDRVDDRVRVYALMATMRDSIRRRVSWIDDGETRFALELSEPPSARAFFSARTRSFSCLSSYRNCCAAWKSSDRKAVDVSTTPSRTTLRVLPVMLAFFS